MRCLPLLLLACGGPPPAEKADPAGPVDDSALETDSGPAPDDTAPPAPESWRSALFPVDWTPASTHESGAFLHDFSYAGYQEGADRPPLPAAQVSVLDEGADPSGVADSQPAFAAAIAACAALAPCTVWVPAGLYRIDGLLEVRDSGVVLAGEGSGQSHLYFTTADGMTDRAHLSFVGAERVLGESLLTEDGLSRGTAVRVADTTGLSVGDEVQVGFVITADFVAAHGMTDTWTVFVDQWKPFFRRTVVALDGDRVTLDVPLRYPVLLRDGASLRRVEGALTEVGVVGLGLSTVGDWDTAWTLARTHALRLEDVRDAYVEDLASFEGPGSVDGRGRHLLSGGVVVRDSRRVTLRQLDLKAPQNRGGGGNGYLVEVSRSNEVLIEDAVAVDGRHNFIQNWDFGSSGLVWRRVHSAGGELWSSADTGGSRGCSEFHHSLSMANLIEQSTLDDCWKAVNRGLESSGAGHTATETTFYNNDGLGYIWSLQAGVGHVIGAGGLTVETAVDCCWIEGLATEPEDWFETEALPLDPPSLYENQRQRRLGD